MSVETGTLIGPLRLPPVNRLTLALYCGASNDYNAEHVDPDAARAAGFDDVFQHGMLSMAHLARLLTDWAGPVAVRSITTRFVDIVQLGDELICRGRVDALREGDLAEVTLWAETATGQRKAEGTALVSIKGIVS